MEDLALNWTLADLREAFDDSMKEFHAHVLQEKFPPTSEDFMLFALFQETARDLNAFPAAVEYTGRLLDSLSKVGKKMVLVTRNKNLARQVLDRVKSGDFAGLTIGSAFRDYAQSEESLKALAEKTQSTLRRQYLAMGHEATFQEEVLPLLAHTQKTQSITREIAKKKLADLLATSSYQDVLEKYAYLSYLVSKDPDVFLSTGVRYFDSSVFSRLFESVPIEKQQQKYFEIEMELRKRFCQELNTQIERIPSYTLLPGERKSKLGSDRKGVSPSQSRRDAALPRKSSAASRDLRQARRRTPLRPRRHDAHRQDHREPQETHGPRREPAAPARVHQSHPVRHLL